jgi:hypothetical protein
LQIGSAVISGGEHDCGVVGVMHVGAGAPSPVAPSLAVASFAPPSVTEASVEASLPLLAPFRPLLDEHDTRRAAAAATAKATYVLAIVRLRYCPFTDHEQR